MSAGNELTIEDDCRSYGHVAVLGGLCRLIERNIHPLIHCLILFSPGNNTYTPLGYTRARLSSTLGGIVHGYSNQRDDLLVRLRRIEGQTRGLQRMVEEDRYCIDVLTQIASTTRALQGVAIEMLDAHVRHCVRDAIDSGNDGDEKIEEAMSVITRLIRS